MKILLLVISFFFFNFAFAQKQDSSVYSTDEIEVNSFFSEGTVFTSPSNISVLNKKSIKNRNGNNLSDILKSVSGVYMKSYGSQSDLQTISMNGLGAEHTVILLNGSKLNSLQNGQIDLSLIPTENVKRIEVMNNGYSSMFGSEAMGGVVNIITDDLLNETKLSAGLSTEFGSYKKRKYSLRLSNNFKKFKYDFLISDEKSDNDYKFYFDNGVDKELRNKLNSAYKISNYSLSSQYNFSKSFNINYYTQFVNADREIAGIETGNKPPDTKQIDKNWNNILKLNYSKSNISVYSDFNFQNNLQNYNTYPVLKSYYKNILLANSNRVEITQNNNSYTFGSEIKYGTLYSNDVKEDIDRKHYSLFTSAKTEIKNLIIYPSLRYDYVTDIKKGAVTYHLGLNYQPFSKIGFHLRGNVSRNFGVPTFNELYWRTGANTDLKPEYSQNYEAGFIYSGNSFIDYTLNFSYLNITAENKIVWLPGRNFIWSPKNIGTSKSQIVIASAKFSYSFTESIYIKTDISYTNNNSKKTNEDFTGDPSVNKQILYIPDEQIQSNLELSFVFLGLNLFHSYIGKRYSDTENLNLMGPVNILDGNIFFDYKISKYTASFKFEINNLTNSDYQIIAGYPAPLRNFNFKINLNYTL
ncbi:MAG: TonB-dependent receptor [Ignavibacteria bacterium]|nr:TonB-dependent receptor [Ignavibacteria bacterium]